MDVKWEEFSKLEGSVVTIPSKKYNENVHYFYMCLPCSNLNFERK